MLGLFGMRRVVLGLKGEGNHPEPRPTSLPPSDVSGKLYKYVLYSSTIQQKRHHSDGAHTT